ncbi:MAG TPA: mercury methylation corrinoid protein HgcA [Smithella sp.]|nr:mercury methylation corrinoid protein HgcA [Smithella sp.]
MDEFELPVIQQQRGCDCGENLLTSGKPMPDVHQSFVRGVVETAAGRLPKVSSTLSRRDRWGAVRARLSAFRMAYRIDPGLYALGEPDGQSPVLVSANYKMSFDVLRASLAGRSAWILVLDTRGINVWCAAGKGTFGTEELIRRIELSGLRKIVAHRKLILPQLGAPGVAAYQVKKISGFEVLYGPVHARDLPAYLDAGCHATAAMRTMPFSLRDRVLLVPIELRGAMKYFFMLPAFFLLIGGLGGPKDFWSNVTQTGLFAVLALLGALIGGAVLVPLLLPYLPGRAFSVKGLWVGLVIAMMCIVLREMNLTTWPGRVEAASWFLILPAVSAYLAMNFTGCSTFTSLSGVKKEMRWALPLQIAGGLAGVILWIGAALMF